MKSKVADFQERTAPEVEQKDEAWFLGELERNCSDVRVNGKDFLIVCPFHADSNPSCGVDRFTGMFKCFACGAGGGWNTLARKIGATELQVKGGRGRGRGSHLNLDKNGLRSIVEMKDDMARAFTKAGVVDPNKKREDKARPIVQPWPESQSWRSVDGERLAALGCVRVTDLMHNTLRIGLPVRDVGGDLLGYTCRALDPEDAEPKYAPLAANRAGWRKKELPAREALFMIDRVLEEDWEVIVLTEGPYDALHLWAHGIPAVAILGTNNWTTQKVAIVAGLGLRAVVVMMDNDTSGRDAQDEIIQTLSPVVRVKGLALPEKVKDPGGLSDKQCEWVRQKVEAL